MKDKRRHYHLYSGEVVFFDPETDMGSAMRLNAVFDTDDQNVRMRDVGKCQVEVQKLFYQKMQDPKLKILDVFCIGISYMGHLTAEDFTAEAASSTVQ